jgi:hypothetical protein
MEVGPKTASAEWEGGVGYGEKQGTDRADP